MFKKSFLAKTDEIHSPATLDRCHFFKLAMMWFSLILSLNSSDLDHSSTVHPNCQVFATENLYLFVVIVTIFPKSSIYSSFWI